jgi:HrpA-like RNA helicase
MYNLFYQNYDPYDNNLKKVEDNIEYWDEKVKKGIFDEEFEHLNPLNNQPWGTNFPTYKDLHKNMLRKLASYTDAKNIFDVVRNHQVTLITMGTGAGKTVMMPKLMLHYFAYQKKVAITIPRRGITESAGIFGADALDCVLGNEVGYRHGSDKTKSSPDTMLLYTTDGTIKAKITSSDPDLNEYNCLIIDEAHERNTNIDILFTLVKNVCQKRPDFKLIIMSATVDTNIFKNYFESNGVTFKNYHVATAQKYTIDKIFLTNDIQKKDAADIMKQYIDQILRVTETGDIIAFVQTMTPANKIIEYLNSNIKHYRGNPIFIAYSSGADPELKDLAQKTDPDTNLPLYMTKGYTRSVIIGTPALESSFTAPGQMVYVIDSGLAKDVWYDPVKFAYVSDTVYISRSSIIQRQGRTGRNCSGQAYMMYSQKLYDSLKEYSDPNILKSDLTNDVLGIMMLPSNKNLKKTLSFLADMLTPPTIESIESSIKLLYNYCLIDKSGDLTDIGKCVATLGKLGPELSRMLMVSYYFNCMDDIILLTAMMLSTQNNSLAVFIRNPIMGSSEEKLLYKKKMDKFYHPRGDHFILINILKSYLRVHEKDREDWCKALDFRYDLFNKVIEPDLNAIKASLEILNFPQMFTHYPPPPAFEEQPTDILETLKRYNKKMLDVLFSPSTQQQTRFNYKYFKGGSGNISYNKSNINKLKDEFLGEVDSYSSRDSEPIVLNLEHLSSRTSDLETFKFNVHDSKEKNKVSLYSKDKSKIEEDYTHKLLKIVNEVYPKRHISDLNIDYDIKKILEITPEEYNYYNFNNNEEHPDSDYQELDIEDLQLSSDDYSPIKDEFFINELSPVIKSDKELYDEYLENEKLKELLYHSKKENPSAFKNYEQKTQKTQKRKKKLQSSVKLAKTLKRIRKPRTDIQYGGEPNKYAGNQKKFQNYPKPIVDVELMEKERKRFGDFLDQISLKTESGILPTLRLFEDPEENIMACIYYGFYMKLAANFYDNKYMVKLSKINSSMNDSGISFDRDKPSLVIYQSLSISPTGTNMGVVSKLSPRIINAFI